MPLESEAATNHIANNSGLQSHLDRISGIGGSMELAHSRLETAESLRRLARGLPVIESALAVGTIYNTDLDNCKSDCGDAYHSERSTLMRHFIRKLDDKLQLYDPRWDPISNLLPLNLAHANTIGKRLQAVERSMKRCKPLAEIDEILADARALFERWAPIAQALNDLKPLVVKGRKLLEESERKTPPRDLSHTGSCSCCLRNVKLSDEDSIVDHGYQIAWGTRNGHCFGVGHSPIEISSEGLSAWIAHVETEIVDRIKGIEQIRRGEHTIRGPLAKMEWRPGDVDYERQLAFQIEAANFTLKQMTIELAASRLRLSEWDPRPLPDGRAEHLMAVKLTL